MTDCFPLFCPAWEQRKTRPAQASRQPTPGGFGPHQATKPTFNIPRFTFGRRRRLTRNNQPGGWPGGGMAQKPITFSAPNVFPRERKTAGPKSVTIAVKRLGYQPFLMAWAWL